MPVDKFIAACWHQWELHAGPALKVALDGALEGRVTRAQHPGYRWAGHGRLPPYLAPTHHGTVILESPSFQRTTEIPAIRAWWQRIIERMCQGEIPADPVWWDTRTALAHGYLRIRISEASELLQEEWLDAYGAMIAMQPTPPLGEVNGFKMTPEILAHLRGDACPFEALLRKEVGHLLVGGMLYPFSEDEY